MIVGGSILIGTATENSDIDIIFIIPSLYLLKFNVCKECEESLKNCNEHDLIFGQNDNSLYFYLAKTLEKEYADQSV